MQRPERRGINLDRSPPHLVKTIERGQFDCFALQIIFVLPRDRRLAGEHLDDSGRELALEIADQLVPHPVARDREVRVGCVLAEREAASAASTRAARRARTSSSGRMTRPGARPDRRQPARAGAAISRSRNVSAWSSRRVADRDRARRRARRQRARGTRSARARRILDRACASSRAAPRTSARSDVERHAERRGQRRGRTLRPRPRPRRAAVIEVRRRRRPSARRAPASSQQQVQQRDRVRPARQRDEHTAARGEPAHAANASE